MPTIEMPKGISMKFTIAMCSLFCGLVVSQSVCFARVEVHPRLTLREEYNDNIYLEANNKNDDYITTVAPGLGVQLETMPLNLFLDYSLEYRKYQNNDSEDETRLSDIQRGLALARIFPDQEFQINLTQEFTRVPIDNRLPSNTANTLVNKTSLSRSVVQPRWHHRFSPTFDLFLDYQYENWVYQSDLGDDLEGQSVNGALIKKISPRLSLLVGGKGGTYNSKFTLDYDQVTGFAGLSVQLTPALSLDAVGGHTWINFKGWNTSDEEDVVADVLARLALGGKYSAGLGFSQDFRNATDQGIYRHQLARAILGWREQPRSMVGDGVYSWQGNYPAAGQDLLSRLLAGEPGERSFWELSLYAMRDRFYSVQREDREAGVAFTSRTMLARNWDLLLGGRIAALEFRPADENVDRQVVDTGVEYLFNQFTVGLHYIYWKDDSDRNINDFVNNIGYLELKVQF